MPCSRTEIEAVLETVRSRRATSAARRTRCGSRRRPSLVALCYPDAYEIGISNQALQILYQQVNRRDGMAAERVYCPWPDMADAMRREGCRSSRSSRGGRCARPTCSGITLQAELTYSNVLEVLDLAGIPLRAADRGEGDPIVVAGGPSASNPAPLARSSTPSSWASRSARSSRCST